MKKGGQEKLSDIIRFGKRKDGHLMILTVLHHDGEELDHHLRAGPDQNLPLASFLSIVDAPQSICQRVHPHHLDLLLPAVVGYCG